MDNLAEKVYRSSTKSGSLSIVCVQLGAQKVFIIRRLNQGVNFSGFLIKSMEKRSGLSEYCGCLVLKTVC